MSEINYIRGFYNERINNAQRIINSNYDTFRRGDNNQLRNNINHLRSRQELMRQGFQDAEYDLKDYILGDLEGLVNRKNDFKLEYQTDENANTFKELLYNFDELDMNIHKKTEEFTFASKQLLKLIPINMEAIQVLFHQRQAIRSHLMTNLLTESRDLNTSLLVTNNN